MSELKLNVIKDGATIYYSDTDSLVTDRRLDPSLVHPSELGIWKLVHEINKGIFSSAKSYAIIDNNGTSINKCKGALASSVT